MNKGLWIARKNYLLVLIKKVSDDHGGDDKDFLDKHCKEVIEVSPEEKIELAIRCYEEIANQTNHYVQAKKPETQTQVNQGIVYRKPFVSHAEVTRGQD